MDLSTGGNVGLCGCPDSNRNFCGEAGWGGRGKSLPICATGGASYLKALKAPFPDTKFLPTGGVSLENALEFIGAGAVPVGVGGEISNWDLLRLKGKNEIANIASRFREILDARPLS